MYRKGLQYPTYAQCTIRQNKPSRITSENAKEKYLIFYTSINVSDFLPHSLPDNFTYLYSVSFLSSFPLRQNSSGKHRSKHVITRPQQKMYVILRHLIVLHKAKVLLPLKQAKHNKTCFYNCTEDLR